MYKVKVNATHSFDISKETMETLDAIQTSAHKYHIIEDHITIEASILKSNFHKKTYSVKVNNNTYEVAIKDALDQQIKALGFEVGLLKQVNDIKAPMPGLILEIHVKPGQEVKEDDSLLILEAMKMENVIKSPRDGIIKSVYVKQGETVDKNALIIEFE